MASISSPWSKLPSATASGRYALPESPRDSAQGWSRVAISNREDCHSTTSNGALFFVPLLREPLGLPEHGVRQVPAVAVLSSARHLPQASHQTGRRATGHVPAGQYVFPGSEAAELCVLRPLDHGRLVAVFLH